MSEDVCIGYKVPDSQRLSYRITPKPGAMMNAEAVGGQIVALAKILRTASNAEEENRKLKWMVGILRIETESDGSITFDLGIFPKSPVQTELKV